LPSDIASRPVKLKYQQTRCDSLKPRSKQRKKKLIICNTLSTSYDVGSEIFHYDLDNPRAWSCSKWERSVFYTTSPASNYHVISHAWQYNQCISQDIFQ